MEENLVEDVMEIFTQDGVLLKSAPANYLPYLNTTGTLAITEYLNSCKKRCMEWKPNDITADSDGQDQEWDVVNVVERRQRTVSESTPLDCRSKYLRVNFTDIKSFKHSPSGVRPRLNLYDGKGETLCSFEFLSGNCDSLVLHLKGMLRTAPLKRDKHTYMVMDDHLENQILDRSFAELNLFNEEPHHFWKFIRNFQESPYVASMEVFAKVTDIGNYFWTYYFSIIQIGRYFIPYILKVVPT